MRKIDKEMPYSNKRLLELVESQADGNVQRFAKMVGLSQQRINRLFIRDTRNSQFPRLTDEIRKVVTERFNLTWDYFVEPIDGNEFVQYKQLSGSDNITDKDLLGFNPDIVNGIENLSHEKLVSLVKELINLHNEQTDMYKMLIRQNEEMIRNGQQRFNNITSLIFKNV